MFYTSYFGLQKHFPEDFIPVAITLYTPEWYKGIKFKYLAPNKEIFKDWCNNHDEEAYRKKFKEEVIDELKIIPCIMKLMELVKVNTLDELLKLNIVFLCYEKDGFCHRHPVADWFTENGLPCVEWKMDNSHPREYTEDEVRTMFLKHLWDLVEYWDNVPKETTKEKISGAIFSTLSTLDGCSMDLPGFIVAPYPHEDDKQYNIEHGENYFAYNNESHVNCEIGGCLHEQFYSIKSEMEEKKNEDC